MKTKNLIEEPEDVLLQEKKNSVDLEQVFGVGEEQKKENAFEFMNQMKKIEENSRGGFDFVNKTEPKSMFESLNVKQPSHQTAPVSAPKMGKTDAQADPFGILDASSPQEKSQQNQLLEVFQQTPSQTTSSFPFMKDTPASTNNTSGKLSNNPILLEQKVDELQKNLKNLYTRETGDMNIQMNQYSGQNSMGLMMQMGPMNPINAMHGMTHPMTHPMGMRPGMQTSMGMNPHMPGSSVQMQRPQPAINPMAPQTLPYFTQVQMGYRPIYPHNFSPHLNPPSTHIQPQQTPPVSGIPGIPTSLPPPPQTQDKRFDFVNDHI
jgi:hypothetical protein